MAADTKGVVELDGRYRILQKLGQGGMSEVYLVEHIMLGRKEALKILQSRLSSSSMFVSRFRREARAINRVQHPNIVGVHDFGQMSDGRFYLAMEYAEGDSLGDILRREKRMPARRAMRIVHQLADAIAHAHSMGVIHRDLKPDNFILMERGAKPDVLKVLDFGIAKIVSRDEKENIVTTAAGEVYGTPAYMSPEQFRGKSTDPRIDLYAAGCILFQLLTGDPPFVGRPVELMHRHLTEAPVRPSQKAPDAGIVPELDALVMRLLEKDPERRLQTGTELLRALEQVPGYPRDLPKERQARRSHPVNIVTMTGLEEESTVDRESPSRDAASEPSPLRPEEALHDAQVCLRRVAEVVQDLGATDGRLVVGIAKIAQVERDLAGNQAELDDLKSKADALEEDSREREASLRFALGELRFDRDRAADRDHTDIDIQIRELETRLSQVRSRHESEQWALTEKAIDLTAKHSHLSDERDRLYEQLDAVVKSAVAPHRLHPQLEPLLGRLASAEEILSLTRR